MSEPDLSEFEELSTGQPKRCRVGNALAELPEEDAAALQAALDKPSIKATAIAQWLGRRGIDVHYNVPAYHRAGNCRCGSPKAEDG